MADKQVTGLKLCACGVPIMAIRADAGAERCLVCKALHDHDKKKAKAKKKAKTKAVEVPERVADLVVDILEQLQALEERDLNLAIKELYREFSTLYVPDGKPPEVDDRPIQGKVEGKWAVYKVER